MQAVHPRVRVVSLLMFALLLPWQGTAGLCVAAIGVGLLLLRDRVVAVNVLRGVRRIRFLLLSLAVLYLFFTPGEPVLEGLGEWSPSWQGIELMFHRAGILLLMLLAALLLVNSTPRAALSESLQRLLQPVCNAGVLPSRLPQRIALVFEQLSGTESAVRAARSADGSILDRAVSLWVYIENAAVQAHEFEQPPSDTSGRVPAVQWMLPLGILMLGSMLLIARPG